MNKITKPILVSALSALAFGTIGVAGTFALFTDNTETAISAQAGIVDVGLNASNLATYSAEANAQGDRIDERGAKYISKPTAVGTFTNGGTASLADGALTMRKLTPGDRVTFDAGLVNHSNVAIKYRLVYKFTGTNGVLAQGLVTKTNISGSQQTYEGLREFVAPWTFLEAGAALPATAITFDIELPISRGNDYQGKEASFSLYVEAVQGNAYVEDEARTLLFGSLTPTQEATQKVVDPAQPIVLQTTSAQATTTVKTTIPANTSYQSDPQQAAEPIKADDTVKLVVSDLVVAEDTATRKGTVDLDIALLVNGVEVTQFSELVNVEVNVGKNLDITSVTHNGNDVTGYTYTASEGILRFTTKNFSPFSVEYTIMPDTSYGFADNYEEKVGTTTYKVHVVDDLSSLRAIGTYLNSSDGAADRYPVFRLKKDIDVSELGSPISVNLRGTLDGNGKKLYGDSDFLTLTGENSVAIFSEYDNTSSLVVKDLTLDKISVQATGQGAALLIGGYNTANSSSSCSMTFANVHATESCSVVADQSKAASFLGKAYGVNSFSATGCTSAASITANGSPNVNIGGFVSTFSNSCASTTFESCVFSGKLTGDNYIGGFTSQNNHPSAVITYTNCKMLGTVTSTTSNAGQVGAFHSATAAGATITYSGCALYDTNKTAKYRMNVSGETVDTDKINGHESFGSNIAVPQDLTTIFTKFNVGTLDISVDPSTHDITVAAYAGAAYYRAMVKIDGKAVNVSGNQVSLYNTRGITIASENFTTVDALKAGFGEIHRLGYIIEDESTPSNPTVFSLDPAFSGGTNIAYIQDNNMCFLRVASNGATVTAIGGLQNTNKLVKVNGEWLLVVNKSGTAISPVGADCNYTVMAYDSDGNVIANASFKVAAGSSMVPLNMSGINFNSDPRPTIDQPYYEYLAS